MGKKTKRKRKRRKNLGKRKRKKKEEEEEERERGRKKISQKYQLAKTSLLLWYGEENGVDLQ